ncbi:class I SAM-dependent methyltransferase [Craurococcus roseus]|uniref:Class I SAM-dependent methyltransferase n=1 Tax=Craurococcus roseus TaxID=77585 RepID=A0ABN1FB14_9PROT
MGSCLAGRISAEVALARLLLGGKTAAGIRAELDARRPEPPGPRWGAMRRLLDGHDAALDRLAAEIAETGGDHSALGGPGAGGVARIAAFFDRAVSHSPEAAVALYSLGDPGILAAATAEAVRWLEGADLLRPGADVLDLGCGFGRVAAALSPRCRSVLGLDVSAGMVAEARRRHAGLPNARFETTPGLDLSALPAGVFDLVLAVDSFPYLVQAGVADAHVAGAARALRAGGALAALNLSYRGDPDRDRADAARWAEAHGMALEVAGATPFALWDGAVFAFRRAP